MIRRQPRSTRTDTLFPYTTLFRSQKAKVEVDSGERPDRNLVVGEIFQVCGYERSVKALDRALADGEPEIAKIGGRSEEHTSELQSLMRISYAVFCLKKKTNII